MKKINLVLLLLIFSNAINAQKIPQIADFPSNLAKQQLQEFNVQKQKLIEQKSVLKEKVIQFNLKCGSVAVKSALERECEIEQAQIVNEKNQLKWDIENFNIELNNARVFNAMESFLEVNKVGWESDEIARISNALKNFHFDVDTLVHPSDVIEIWQNIHNRTYSKEFMDSMRLGKGPKLYEAGKQGDFQDCTIYALATASGQPYGVVAARANKLISEGDWRKPEEQLNSQKIIEEHGLMGGEVVMLTEVFGQVKLIPSTDFAKTIKQGSSIMINVLPSDGNFKNGHQVVLSKTILFEGETWYEIIDSNVANNDYRLYINNTELNKIINEKGIVYSPDKTL